MIVTKTPLRVSFFGGGTDLPEYYEQYPGKVLSVAINVYMHIVINETPHESVKACYDQIEVVEHSNQIKHDRIRESLLEYNIDRNIEVSSFCHIPTKGTGLGSSSSFTVGLCTALSRRKSLVIQPGDIAETAYHIERNRCGDRLGKQDQYAAAYGGLNLITFNKDKTIVEPVVIDDKTWRELENRLMFFYTGVRRNANDILEMQAKNTESGSNINSLRELAICADIGAERLRSSDLNSFGRLLHYGWLLKSQMQTGITNDVIDEQYTAGILAGALGGKLLGAGGGGYLMFYVEPEYQEKVRQAVKLQEYKFKFSKTGTEVVYEHRESY